MKIIKSKIELSSTIYTDEFRVYDSLIKEGFHNHQRVEHGRNEFTQGDVHANGIGDFWSIFKTRLSKFRELGRKAHISLHVKECEYRFNHRHENLYSIILTNLQNSLFNPSICFHFC